MLDQMILGAGGPLTCDILEMWMLEKPERVQVHFTLDHACLSDQRNLNGWKIYTVSYMASNKWCFMVYQILHVSWSIEHQKEVKWLVLIYKFWQHTYALETLSFLSYQKLVDLFIVKHLSALHITQIYTMLKAALHMDQDPWPWKSKGPWKMNSIFAIDGPSRLV
jgi:hypothetical protein